MASIDQINAFIQVYELHGYSAAARELGKGRTTVRELILMLEEKLDLTLFDIEGRRAQPTSDADRLYPHAKLLQSQLLKFTGLTESLKLAQESQVTIYYDAMLPDGFMVSLTSLLCEKFINVKVLWKMEKWQKSIDYTAECVTSVSFLTNKVRRFSDPRIENYFLGFNDFAIFAGKNSALIELETIKQIDLRNAPQLVPQSMLEEDLNGYIIFANNYIALNSNDEIRRLLKEVGWAILPKADMARYVENGELVQITPDFMFNDMKMSMAAYYHPVINRGPVMTYFLSLLPALSKQYFQ